MCLETKSDEDLAKEVQEGNRLAMNMLVLRYQHRLFGWLRRRGSPWIDAEEILQQLWLRVLFRTIGNFRPDKGSFFGWLIFQLRSCLAGYSRFQGNHPVISLDEVLADTGHGPGIQMDPSLDLLRAEDWEQLERLLAHLPCEKRQVIHLSFIVGLSQSETAEFLGIPENTVASRKFDALNRLRKWWNEGNCV